MEVSDRWSHALESLTAHKITILRCKYLATMATGNDNDDDDDDGATTTMTTTMVTVRWAMRYNDDGGG